MSELHLHDVGHDEADVRDGPHSRDHGRRDEGRDGKAAEHRDTGDDVAEHDAHEWHHHDVFESALLLAGLTC